MGKKYIIELPENTHWIQWIMEGTKDHHPYMDYKQVEDLTPYTEPDLEQVKKDYDAFYEHGYEQGLADAWECARTLWNTTNRKAIFGYTTFSVTLTTLTAQEAIEKIRQYEQEKEELFLIGDEVEGDEDGRRGVVIDSRFENSQVAVLTGNSKVYSWWSKCAIHKTGRHFPEIAAVLQKMKEADNG